MHGYFVMSVTSTAVMDDQITVRLGDDLARDLQKFRQQQRFPPNKSDVVRQALREFLDRELTDS